MDFFCKLHFLTAHHLWEHVADHLYIRSLDQMKENISELSGNSVSLTKSTVKCPKVLSVSHYINS